MEKQMVGCMAVVVLLAVQVRAAEIAFTGGEGGASRDLAVAANWDGGELPSGAGVTGVVNVATFGTSYTVGADAALSGLKFALKGLSDRSQVVFHEDTGLLEVYTRTGSVILLR